MDVLPGPHANVLIYLMSIIRQIFEWPVFLQNPEAKRRISTILKDISDSSSGFLESINTKSDEGWFRGYTTERDVDGKISRRLSIYIHFRSSKQHKRQTFSIYYFRQLYMKFLYSSHLRTKNVGQIWGDAVSK